MPRLKLLMLLFIIFATLESNAHAPHQPYSQSVHMKVALIEFANDGQISFLEDFQTAARQLFNDMNVVTFFMRRKLEELSQRGLIRYTYRKGRGIGLLDGLDAYEIVIITTHGREDRRYGPVLWTGEMATLQLDMKYRTYLKTGVLTKNRIGYLITPRYMKQKVSFGKNSLVINLACDSAGEKKLNRTLMESELHAGARAVAACLGKSQTLGNNAMVNSLLDQLAAGSSLSSAIRYIGSNQYWGNQYIFSQSAVSTSDPSVIEYPWSFSIFRLPEELPLQDAPLPVFDRTLQPFP